MEHYFTNNPSIDSSENLLSCQIGDYNLKFYTDNGVFSKKNVDFGTKTLLESFYTDKEKANVVDIGCGYGVISIFLAKKYELYSFTMVDVNSRSLNLSEKNIKLNNLKNNFKVLENNALDDINDNFDIAITNPPIRAGKEVVHKIMKQSYETLNADGELWVVIQKKQGMASCKKLLENMFSYVEVVKKNKGYYILKAVK